MDKIFGENYETVSYSDRWLGHEGNCFYEIPFIVIFESLLELLSVLETLMFGDLLKCCCIKGLN